MRSLVRVFIYGFCIACFTGNTSQANDWGVIGERYCRESALGYEDSIYQRPIADQIRKHFEGSVYQVRIGATRKFAGNATLVSDQGHFLTAAHLLPDGQNDLEIWLVRPPVAGESEVTFKAAIRYRGKPGYSPAQVKDDIAVLQAIGWDRLDKVATLSFSNKSVRSGLFLAYPSTGKPLTYYGAEATSSDPGDPDGPFRGTAFPGRSGAMVLDDFGVGQGVVAAYNNQAYDQALNDRLPGESDNEAIARFLDARERFGIAVIAPGAPWLRELPMESDVASLVQKCIKDSLSPADTKLLKKKLTGDELSLNSLDALYQACFTESSKKQIELSLFILSSVRMAAKCASLDDGWLPKTLAGLKPSQKVALGRLALEQHVVKGGGAAIVQLGNRGVAPKGQLAANLPSALVEAIRQLDSATALQVGVYSLQSNGDAKDPWVSFDIAKGKILMASNEGSLMELSDQRTKSILGDVIVGLQSGGSTAQARDLGVVLAVAQQDFSSAAALTIASYAPDNKKWTSVDFARAQKDLAYFATKEEALNGPSDWTRAVKRSCSGTKCVTTPDSVWKSTPKPDVAPIFDELIEVLQ